MLELFVFLVRAVTIDKKQALLASWYGDLISRERFKKRFVLNSSKGFETIAALALTDLKKYVVYTLYYM